MIARLRNLPVVPFTVSLFVFFLPMQQKVSIACIWVLIAAWILFFRSSKEARKCLDNKILLASLAFYFFHLLSIVYSSDLGYAFFDLQSKLCFFLFPFLLPSFAFKEEQVSLLKKVFISGILLACLICLVRAIILYSSTGDIGCFFYFQYSWFIHPAYFTIYLNLALLFSIEIFFTEFPKPQHIILKFVLMIFLIANIAILSSRTAVVVSFFTAGIYAFSFLAKGKIHQNKKILAVIAIIAAVVLELSSLHFYDRFAQIEEAINTTVKKDAAGEEKQTGLSVRIQLWKNAVEVIKENLFFGVGVGDIKEELVKMYEKNNYELGAVNRLNPHNQYLQTGVSLGLVGILLLVLMLLIPLVLALRAQNWLYALFILSIALNCVTESILERQAGIIFFTFFNSLFANQLFLKAKAGENF